MNDTPKTRSITFKDFLTLFIGKWWIIVIIPLLCIGMILLQQHFFFTPEYESTATLYILKRENESSDSTTSDFSLALDVVNDCTYILKSHAVLDEVIESLGLEMSYDNLYDSIETNNPSDTRILEVTVTTNSASLSQEIADQVCLIGIEKITEAMGFEQVNLYETGLLSSEPSNQLTILAYALIGILAGIITYSAIVIAYVFDDTLRTQEDIERYLGLSVLGNIPNANEKKSYNYGYYKTYGSGSNHQSVTKQKDRY